MKNLLKKDNIVPLLMVGVALMYWHQSGYVEFNFPPGSFNTFLGECAKELFFGYMTILGYTFLNKKSPGL
ncbi:hypothetical protein JMN23_24895 [Bacillus sp. RHFB]|nr:hypothetical protein [Bacillus sp. RHFB]